MFLVTLLPNKHVNSRGPDQVVKEFLKYTNDGPGQCLENLIDEKYLSHQYESKRQNTPQTSCDVRVSFQALSSQKYCDITLCLQEVLSE